MILSGTARVRVHGPGGELVRAGGWGHVVGDEGSGYWIGKEAMRRAIRAADGRGPATALTERLCQAAGVKHILDVFGPVTRGDFDRPWIARLAPLVAQTAAEGDAVADEIMNEAAYELALHVASVIRRAPWFADVDAVPTVTAGGVFGLGADWYHRVKQALAREAPRARLTVWVKEPILGAVYLALKELYGDIPDHVRQRLVELRARYGADTVTPSREAGPMSVPEGPSRQAHPEGPCRKVHVEGRRRAGGSGGVAGCPAAADSAQNRGLSFRQASVFGLHENNARK